MKRRFALGVIVALVVVSIILLLTRHGGEKPASSVQVLVITQDSRVVLLPQQNHFSVTAVWKTSSSNSPAPLASPPNK